MDQRVRLLIFGLIALLILAGILVLIFYLGRNLVGKPAISDSATNNALMRLRGSVTPTPTIGGTGELDGSANVTPITGGNTKLYQGRGFSLRYPANWGILTCNNSQNFEFDPYIASDVRNVICTEAQKPITFLISKNLTCPGETVKLGAVNAVKSSKINPDGSTTYRWCVNLSNLGFDISHRVSSTPTKAKSHDDFSGKVEEVISTISTSASTPGVY